MIVATAGHIDHGKSALVRALTGVDTDRLPEEKARGISIDLGFAYAQLAGPGAEPVGFVDVPGHERFIANMLAGVAGIDFALIVVAADDGPMPQTDEHLAILDLLGVTAGAVAIAKIDKVAPARVAEVEALMRARLAPTGLGAAPILGLSSITGEGVAELRAVLAMAARDLRRDGPAGGFRLAIDRAFTVTGAGLVVTGTVHAGAVRPGDRLRLSPGGIEVRVRGLHAQNQSAARGQAGQRCAINIAGPGVARDRVSRGDWLVAADLDRPTRRLDTALTLLAGERRPLKTGTPVHLHLGAADVTARVALLDGPALEPGASGLAQLVLDRPIGALAGDRLILRDQSARRTLGGGRVIDPFPGPRGRTRPERRARLRALAHPDRAQALRDLIEIGPQGADLGLLRRAWNLPEAALDQVAARTGGHRVRQGESDILVAAPVWQTLLDRIGGTVDGIHSQEPDRLGLSEADLQRRLPRPLRPAVLGGALDHLVRAGALARRNALIARPDHRPKPTRRDQALWHRVAPLLAEGAARPPSQSALIAALGLDQRAALGFLNRAVRLGLAVRVADNRLYLPAAIAGLADLAETLAAEAEDGAFDAAEFRDRSGIGRNITIQVLEYFDRVGLTRRAGQGRRIVRPAAEVFGPPP